MGWKTPPIRVMASLTRDVLLVVAPLACGLVQRQHSWHARALSTA